MQWDWIQAIGGGLLIGLAVTWLWLSMGRIAGISGIFYGVISPVRGEWRWRLVFLLGLISGGLCATWINPNAFADHAVTTRSLTLFAGLLVGFGTALGSGCTSGHGVCGLSRLSLRSTLATVTFILVGMACVSLFRQWGFYL